MRATDHFEFAANPIEQSEAMFSASKALIKGRHAILNIFVTLVLTILTGLGGMAIATVLASWADVNPSWWVILGWFAGGAFFLGSYRLLYGHLAKRITLSPLHQAPQSLSFDVDGMTYGAANASWFTPWAMIDQVIETKRTITVIVAGTAFGLPKTAIGDADAVAALFSDIQEQLAHA